MDIAQNLNIFWFLFLPGFISLKVYEMIVPQGERDISNLLYEVCAYGALNLAAFSWLIYGAYYFRINENHPVWFGFILLWILFIAPILWPIIWLKIRTWRVIARYIVHPIKKPWDFVFGKREAYWTIVNLTDGRRIGGRYDSNSFVSSYPADEQIYLEEVWKLNGDGKFVEQIKGSRGILISGKDILTIEFLKEEENNNDR